MNITLGYGKGEAIYGQTKFTAARKRKVNSQRYGGDVYKTHTLDELSIIST